MVTSATNRPFTESADLGSLLLGKTRGAVLELLLTRPDEEFHVRQVGRLSHAGLGPVQRELKTLAGVGILQRREVGRQVFYRADIASPVYDELRGLILKTVGAAGILATALRPLAGQILVAFLFGSFAQGRAQSSSDVDVMIVGDVPFTTVARALAPAQHRLGREVNPSVYQPAEFAEKVRSGHHFVTTVMREPKVFLLGDQHELSRVAEERLAAAASEQPKRDRRTARRGRA